MAYTQHPIPVVKIANADESISEVIATEAKQDDIITQLTSISGDTTSLDGKDFATSAKQLADNHNVTVSNMISAVETGLAKETTLNTVNSNILNVESDVEATNVILTDKTQYTKLTDGTNDVSVTTNGSFNVNLEELESSISTNSNSQLKTTLYGEDGTDLRIEKITCGIPNINTDHALIHQGYGFSFSTYISLSSSGVKTFCLTSPADLFIHLKNINIQTLGASIKMELLIDADVTVNTGTVVPLNNLNHNSTYTADSSIRESPTFTGGTVVRTIYALADSTNQITGTATFNANENQEYVTKDGGEQYIIRITNLSSSDATVVALDGFMYEEGQGLVSY
jgi:hypothetical protein